MPPQTEGLGEIAQPPQTLDERYELIEQIGAGGMSRVWRARDTRLGRDVAIKVISGAIDESRRHKIAREARALAAVSHPNIVGVFDYGEAHAGGKVLPYVVMELIDGPDLHRYLIERGPMSVTEATEVLVSVLAAVQLAHNAGIVHGDLKPANVFMGSHGPKVGDFGVARILDEETGNTTVAATPTFAAPEVLKGARPTIASDVYSAACLAFELLVGRPPYEGTNAWEIATKHIEAPIPTMSDARGDIPRDLDAAIHRAMSKNPKDRYPDAASFSDAIAAVPHQALQATVPMTAGAPVARAETEALTTPRPNLTRVALLGPLAGPWERGASFLRREARTSRLLAAALLAFLLVVAFLAMRDRGSSLAIVPDVVGDPYREAMAELRLEGFTVDVSFRPAEQRHVGRVIETVPRASAEVPPGSEVHLIAGATSPTPEPVVQQEDDDDEESEEAEKEAQEQRKRLEEQQKKAEEEQKKAEEAQKKSEEEQRKAAEEQQNADGQ